VGKIIVEENARFWDKLYQAPFKGFVSSFFLHHSTFPGPSLPDSEPQSNARLKKQNSIRQTDGSSGGAPLLYPSVMSFNNAQLNSFDIAESQRDGIICPQP
jgi:hypothetical protein